jgi:hypothetical protein
MSYDTVLADRVRSALGNRPGLVEKKRFGGLAFLLGGRMFCGVLKDDLVVRLGPERYDEALWEPHVRAMDFTGKPMVGYVYVAPPGVETADALQRWLDAAIELVTSLAPAKPDASAKPKPPAAKKPAAKKPAPKPAAKKPPAKKKLAAKKPAPKKAAAKKPAAKKSAKPSPKRRAR